MLSATTESFALLIVAIISIILLIYYVLSKRPLSQLQKSFLAMLICVLIISSGVFIQDVLTYYTDIAPIYVEYFIYIGTCFLPVALFFTALIFKNTKITFKKSYLFLFVIPVLSLLVLWTNDYHHLFFVDFPSNRMDEVVFGPYFYVHSLYTYGLIFIGMFMMFQSSLKNSGMFSKQSILIFLGSIIPIIINILGTTKLVSMSLYLTPISFTIAMIFYAFAILKFNFLSISPIALQKIVNVMSDSYLVLDTNNNIVDYNDTFTKNFNIDNIDIRKKTIFDLLSSTKNLDNFKKAFYESIKNKKTYTVEYHNISTNKYFNVEISPLFNTKVFIGVLLLFKDITQHVLDIKKIKDNQDMLMESERLASLGQLIGGIAHNLKTPIMSISGATEGLSDLIKEYDSSIDDPEVNSKDHHDIAKDMMSWIEKIREYTSYMSDVITVVKGQAVTMSEADNTTFDVEELVKRVDILMKHELKSALVYLKVSVNLPEHTTLHGDVNSLVQVINNMISNSIQSYEGKPEQSIDLIFEKHDDKLYISVKDYGCGLPQKVQDKLFKEMITTKGKNGTGLGLYMSYSTIKAHFGGDITFKSEPGKGTTFTIILPL